MMAEPCLGDEGGGEFRQPANFSCDGLRRPISPACSQVGRPYNRNATSRYEFNIFVADWVAAADGR